VLHPLVPTTDGEADALECFFTSPIDTLAIGPFVVDKGAT